MSSGTASTYAALADAARSERLKILDSGLPVDPVAPLGGRGGETKDRILDTAIALFGERGFEACTMRDLATEVGIKAPAIYNHYPSKEDVLAAALEHILGRFFSALLLPLADEQPEEWLEPIVKGHVRFRLQHRRLARANDVLLSAPVKERTLPPVVCERIAKVERGYVALIGTLVQLCAPKQDAHDGLLAAFAIAAVCNHAVAWYDPAGKMSAEEVATRSWELAQRMIGAPPEAPQARL